MTDVRTEVEPAVAELAFDNPEAYLSGDRRRALAAGVDLPDRVRGAALFADISGFTLLTEVLAAERGAQRGAEELTATLNRVFHAVIADLDRFGGDVIYFSGDALTCWLDGDDGVRATACALAMQQTMARVGEVVTPGAATVHLALKVAVAVGTARRFVVGDPEIQLIEVLAGSLVDELAAAEGLAETGEVVLDSSALESLGHRVHLAEQRVDEQTGRTIGVVRSLDTPVADTGSASPTAILPEDLVRPWILPAVYERLRTGRGEFLAELRPAIPVFVRFGGIDFDADDAVSTLEDFVRSAQRILTGYGGNLLQLTLGDKGAYLYAVFGSPLAHEDDAGRAAAAALDLLELEHATAVSGLQIGITTGRLRSGTYGHTMRRTFVCLGDAVNLAARLMSKAPLGGVYVTEAVREQAGDSFAWRRLPDLEVRGKSNAVAAYSLIGLTGLGSRRRTHEQLELVGRGRELAALDAALQDSLQGGGVVVGVAAEAGLGKSRLVAEFVHSLREADCAVAVGACPPFGTHASYHVWQEVWRRLWRVDDQQAEEDQILGVARILEAIDPALVQRLPLLGPLLGLTVPDNALTRTFDPKLRKTSLEGLLAECLQSRAGEEPLVLVLEDCHWIDPLSRDLLEVLARAALELPVLVVLNYRPGVELGLEQLPQFRKVELTELPQADAERLAHAKLEQLFGAGARAPQALVDLVTARSQGNPFYVEELLNYVRGQGVDPEDEAAVRTLQLPESLHSLILSRVDTLTESPRRTLKVASVVGRSFRAPALPDIYAELGSVDDVRAHLGTLRALDLVDVERQEDEAYVFKHVITQEVAYESMPFATRAMLHERVGGYIEAAEADAVGTQLDLLAHHYWLSENDAKKREYLVRAGEAAQANYANSAAIDYFERAAPLVPEGERANLLLELGKVLELVGEWQRAEEVERDAHAHAARLADDRSRAWCEAALAEVVRKQGRYEEALGLLDQAAVTFEALADDAGLGQVHHLAGTLAAQQGDYEQAIARYEASLEIRERLDDRAGMGGLLSNLGVVAEYQGDYDASWEYHEWALALRTELGDRRAIAVSLTNLGMIAVHRHDYAEAHARFDDAMRLNQEVGDAWMVAISHNNLGNAARGLGDHDAARVHYSESLRAYRDYDDKWALAFLLEDIGQLAVLLGEPRRALELVGAADRLRDEIGAPRSPGLEEQLETQLAGGADTLDSGAYEASRTRGRDLDSAAAIQLALAFCETPD